MGVFRVPSPALAFGVGFVLACSGSVLAACGDDGTVPDTDTGADTGIDGDASDVGGDGGDDAEADTGIPDGVGDVDVDADAETVLLAVTGTSPEDGETDVPLDLTIAVSFDRDLVAETVDEAALTVVADGEHVAGQIMATANTVVFVAPALLPTTEYTVTVSTALRGADGAALSSDFAFTFTTGETYSDGSTPRPPEFRPLGRRFGLGTKVEYLLLGLDNPTNVQLRDPLQFNGADADAEDDLVYGESNPDLILALDKRAASGALDADFYDETVAVSWPTSGTGTLVLFDHDDDSHASSTVSESAVSLVIDGRPEGAYRYDVDLGDVNGDGLDEVVVGGVIDGASPAEQRGAVWVIGDALDGPEVLHTIDLAGEFDPSIGDAGLDRIDVSAGNLDRDSAEELVVVFHVADDTRMSLIVYDDAGHGFDELAHAQLGDALAADPLIERHVRVTTGDVDNDGFDEVLAGYGARFAQPGCNVAMWLVDDATEEFSMMASRAFSWCDDFPQMPREVALLDIDNDGGSELVAFGVVAVYPYYAETPTIEWFNGSGVCDGASETYFEVLQGQGMSVGDVNGDMRQDLVFVDQTGAVVAIGCVEHPHYDPDTGELVSITNHIEEVDRRGPFGSAFDGAVLVTPNVDRDSIVLGYGGMVPDPDAGPVGPGDPTPTIYQDHTVYFADNRILAVVAAPPCAEGIGQNTEACTAGFGTTVGGSISAGVTVAARAGVLVGMEAEVQAGFLFASTTVAKAEAELTAELEVTVHATTTVAMTQTITNTTGFDQDLVIFSATPYDRYVYGIVSHPDEDLLGQVMTIDVPQRTRIFAVSREYYNATNGDQMDIGPAILPSTPGRLDTYPRRADVAGFLSLPNIPLGMVGPVTTNQGTGSQSLEHELSSEVSAGGEIKLNVDSMAKVCGATFCGGVTVGFSIGASFETAITAGTVFTSEVGAIDAAHFPTERYDYGMFAYMTRAHDPNGDVMQTFVVVNHWVD